MKSKHTVKIVLTFLILAFIVYFNIHPIPTLIKSVPTITIIDSNSGLSNTENSVKSLEEAGDSYYVKFNIKENDLYSGVDFELYDDKGSQIPIKEFKKNSDGTCEVWFLGEAAKKYQLVYNNQTNDKEYSVDFHTPTQNSDTENPSQVVETYIKKHLQDDVTAALYDNIINQSSLTTDIFSNVKPYYTPSDEEKKAIFQAFWDTYIKDWKDWKVEMTESGSSSYSFTITYHWDKPNMEELNRKIDERENQLKKELGNNYKAVFQKIIAEIPAIIKNTPPEKNKEKETNDVFLSKDQLQNLRNGTYYRGTLWIPDEFKETLSKLYP